MPGNTGATPNSITEDEEAWAAWKAHQRALRVNDPFNTWVLSSATTGAGYYGSGNATNSTIWTAWTEGCSHTSNTAATNQTWTIWAQQVITSSSISATQMMYGVQQRAAVQAARQINARMSPEERAEQEERQRVLAAKYEAEKAERELARAKAEVLLGQMLTAEQREDLRKKQCFYLYSGGKKYRIDRGRTGNVKLVDEKNQVVESYCIHPQLDCPDADTMLAQKLLLETDRETFERVANISGRSAQGRTRAGVGLARAQ